MIQIDRCSFDMVCIDKSQMIRAIFYFLLLPNFSFHTSRVRLKHKYLFRSRKKKLLFCIQQKLMCICAYKMAAKAKVRFKLLDVFKEFNNFVDMNGSNIDK